MGKTIEEKGEVVTTFVTHNTGLAIALLTKGHELAAIYKDRDCKYDPYAYHFKHTPRVQLDADAFLKGQLFVNSKTLFMKMYELSARTDEICHE